MHIKKKGYFFVLDAVLALFVLVIGVFLLTSSYTSAPQPAALGVLSDDLLKFLSDNKIKDLNNPYGGIGGELWNQGLITDPDNSLLQQIGEFYATNNHNIAEKFIQNVSKDVVPQQFRYEIWINGTVVYPQNLLEEHKKSKNSTELLLTSKKLAFGIINKTSSEIWGPYKIEVFIWQK